MEASAGGHSETHKEMKKAILEVLLVNAEGIGHTNVVGKLSLPCKLNFVPFTNRQK